MTHGLTGFICYGRTYHGSSLAGPPVNYSFDNLVDQLGVKVINTGFSNAVQS